MEIIVDVQKYNNQTEEIKNIISKFVIQYNLKQITLLTNNELRIVRDIVNIISNQNYQTCFCNNNDIVNYSKIFFMILKPLINIPTYD